MFDLERWAEIASKSCSWVRICPALRTKHSNKRNSPGVSRTTLSPMLTSWVSKLTQIPGAE